MRQRNKRNIVIGILCVMVVFMGVGYAVLSQNLNINGTANITGSWDIYIDSITFNNTESSPTTSGTGEVDTSDKTKASYQANLLKPQDVVVYDVVVANNGTIDAILDDITLTPEDNEYFKFETIGIEAGEELNAKTGSTPTTKSFKIKITFKDSVTEANMPASGTKVDGLVKLDYVQEGVKFETGGLPGDEIPTEESDFLVTSDGVLLSYKGTNPEVTVPAEVNGVRITKIAPYAFNKSDFILLKFTDGTQKAVITNDDKAETIREVGAQVGIVEYPRSDVYTKMTSNNFVLDSDHILPHIITDSDILSIKNRGTENTFLHVTSLDLSEMIYLEEILPYVVYTELLVSGSDCPNCSFGSLTTLKLPMNGVLHTIGKEAFALNRISSIVLPNTLTTIGYDAFSGNKISESTLVFDDPAENPSKLISIDGFSDNLFTKLPTLPKSIKTIGEDAFNRNQISELVIPYNITTIGSGAFSVNQISDLFFEDTDENPSELTTIGDRAFSENNLTNTLVIPSSVKNIGEYVFSKNYSLSKIIIKRSDSTGMTLGKSWNGTTEVIYNPNYVG